MQDLIVNIIYLFIKEKMKVKYKHLNYNNKKIQIYFKKEDIKCTNIFVMYIYAWIYVGIMRN